MRNKVENNSDNDDDDYHDGYEKDDNVHECENNMTRKHNRIKNLKIKS